MVKICFGVAVVNVEKVALCSNFYVSQDEKEQEFGGVIAVFMRIHHNTV